MEEKRQLRFRFMEQVYRLSLGDTYRWVDLGEIAPVLGLGFDDALPIAQYLVDERLLTSAGMLGLQFQITHQGVVEVEDALSVPAQPTQHFPAQNLTHVEQTTQPQIQQGTVSSSQESTRKATDYDSKTLREFFSVLEKLKSQLGLTVDEEAELEAQKATLMSQMRSRQPRRLVLREAADALVKILKSAPGGEAAQEILEHLPRWLPL
jgi:hypothetical protein